MSPVYSNEMKLALDPNTSCEVLSGLATYWDHSVRVAVACHQNMTNFEVLEELATDIGPVREAVIERAKTLPPEQALFLTALALAIGDTEHNYGTHPIWSKEKQQRLDEDHLNKEKEDGKYM